MFIPTQRKEEKGGGGKSLAVSIEEDLRTLPKLSKNCCIYRVPENLRELNEKAFTPVFVSIGPLHYKNVKLLPMEPHKLRCLQSFLSQAERNKDLNYYVQFIRDKEARIREAYAEPIPLSSEEFIRMVLVDSAFIIQLFRSKLPIKPLHNDLLTNDLRLAENQLPFFILKDIYQDAFSNSTSPQKPFTDIACDFLDIKKCRIKVDNTNEARCFHLLDMIGFSLFPTRDELLYNKNVREGSRYCHTAIGLHEAGIKFRVDSASTSSLPDIRFDVDKGILTIPKIEFSDDSESEFRNLTAFEQCQHCPSEEIPYFGQYICFLDELINSAEDVKLLVKEGVIENLLGNEREVSDIINSLGIGIYFDWKYYIYRGISKQLNDHCNKKWNRYNATLKHVYFRHPWAVISVIAATILLFLTILQVIAGILAVPGVMK